MPEDRPGIPAELRRRVLVEAGHRCAIPTCRHIEVDVHHIVPWEKCRHHEYDNLIALCPNCHRRADRGEIDRKSLRLYKANLRFAHDKFSHVELDILFELYRTGPGAVIQWPPFMHILIKRIIEAGYISVQKAPAGSVEIMGMQAHPDSLVITEKGRAFVEELGLHEL
ncbi:MAG: HNH endonuclease signature motif containing protein [Planctomycetota bacterium]